jgi:hypothetical protein
MILPNRTARGSPHGPRLRVQQFFIHHYGCLREASAFDRPRFLKSKIAPIVVPRASPIAKLGAMFPDDAPTAAPMATPIAIPTPIPSPDELTLGLLVLVGSASLNLILSI